MAEVSILWDVEYEYSQNLLNFQSAFVGFVTPLAEISGAA